MKRNFTIGLLLILGSSTLWAAESSLFDDLQGEIAALRADASYQTALPDGEASQDSAGTGNVSRHRSASPQGRFAHLGPNAVGGLLEVLVWGGVVVVVVLVVFALGKEIRHGRRRDVALPTPAAPSPASASVAVPSEAEALALAARGAYGHATHALLRAAIAILATRRRGTLSPALTSREVLAQVELNEAARAAFGVLTAAGERFHFGATLQTAGDYARSLTAYHTVVGNGSAIDNEDAP